MFCCVCESSLIFLNCDDLNDQKIVRIGETNGKRDDELEKLKIEDCFSPFRHRGENAIRYKEKELDVFSDSGMLVRFKVTEGSTFKDTEVEVKEIRHTGIKKPRFGRNEDDRVLGLMEDTFCSFEFPSMEIRRMFKGSGVGSINSYVELSKDEILASELEKVMILNLRSMDVQILDSVTDASTWFELLCIEERGIFVTAMQEIYLWTYSDRKCFCTLSGGECFVRDITYDSISDQLYSIDDIGDVRIYDLDERSLKIKFQGLRVGFDVNYFWTSTLCVAREGVVLVSTVRNLLSIENIKDPNPEVKHFTYKGKKIFVVKEIEFEDVKEGSQLIEKIEFLGTDESLMVNVLEKTEVLHYPVSFFNLQRKECEEKEPKAIASKESFRNIEDFDLVNFLMGIRDKNPMKYFELFCVFRRLSFRDMMFCVCRELEKVKFSVIDVAKLFFECLSKLEGYDVNEQKIEDHFLSKSRLKFKSSLTLTVFGEIQRREREVLRLIEKEKMEDLIKEKVLKWAVKLDTKPLKLERHNDYENLDVEKFLDLEKLRADLLKKLYESKKFSNLTLKTTKGSDFFLVHKDILILKSNFFYEMFKFPGQESRQSEVEISYMSDDSLKLLLEIIYLNEIGDDCSIHVLLQVLQHCIMYFEKKIEKSITKILRTRIHSLFKDDCNTGLLKLLELGNLINNLPEKVQKILLNPIMEMKKEEIISNAIQYSVKMNQIVEDLQVKVDEKEEKEKSKKTRKRKRDKDDENLDDPKRRKKEEN